MLLLVLLLVLLVVLLLMTVAESSRHPRRMQHATERVNRYEKNAGLRRSTAAHSMATLLAYQIVNDATNKEMMKLKVKQNELSRLRVKLSSTT